MRKFLKPVILMLFTFAVFGNISNASSSVKKINNKNEKNNFYLPMSITVGFTDACGQCWEYTITAETRSQIWAAVHMMESLYELGFCGYFTPVYPD